MVSETLKNMYPPQLPTLKLAKSNVRLLTYLVLYLIFLLLGAAIFSAIEFPDETKMMRALRNRREKFLKDFPCISGGWWVDGIDKRQMYNKCTTTELVDR